MQKEKETEADVTRRQAEELKYLSERSRREKEVGRRRQQTQENQKRPTHLDSVLSSSFWIRG